MRQHVRANGHVERIRLRQQRGIFRRYRLRGQPVEHAPVKALVFFEFVGQYLLAHQHNRALAALVNVAHQLHHARLGHQIIRLVQNQRPLAGGQLFANQIQIGRGGFSGGNAHFKADFFQQRFFAPGAAQLHVIRLRTVGHRHGGRRLAVARWAVQHAQAG